MSIFPLSLSIIYSMIITVTVAFFGTVMWLGEKFVPAFLFWAVEGILVFFWLVLIIPLWKRFG